MPGGTLICDSAAAAMMRVSNPLEENIKRYRIFLSLLFAMLSSFVRVLCLKNRRREWDAVVVGADRVCANGDTANKIGSYNLAVVAAGHGVPFFVASPFTTLDTTLVSGDEIVIEERPAEELIESSRAPSSIDCWNPAFDVTPAKYIAGIITEKGVIEPVDGKLMLRLLCK